MLNGAQASIALILHELVGVPPALTPCNLLSLCFSLSLLLIFPLLMSLFLFLDVSRFHRVN